MSEAGGRFRARGPLGRVGALLAPGSAAALGVGLERNVVQRRRRLVAAAQDRWSQRRRPTRPTMRSLHAVGPGRLEWREVPEPPLPGPDGALVRPIAVATCDLDRAMVLGAAPFVMPLALGHECVAEVVEVGERVRAVTPGQRVVVPFQISCGTCRACRAGLTSNCGQVPPVSMYGFGVAGGHWGGVLADRVAVPFADAMLVPLPAGVDPVAAASVADTICDAYRHVAPHLPGLLARDPDIDVLIVGRLTSRALFAPSVPLYAGQIALALGAPRVRLVDDRAHVRATGAALGLTPLHPRELRRAAPAALVVAASATARGLRAAFTATAEDGVCSSVGGLHHSARLPVASAYARNLTYHVGRSDARRHIPGVLSLMSEGRFAPERVISTRGSLDDARELLDRHYHTGDVKTVLTV